MPDEANSNVDDLDFAVGDLDINKTRVSLDMSEAGTPTKKHRVIYESLIYFCYSCEGMFLLDKTDFTCLLFSKSSRRLHHL